VKNDEGFRVCELKQPEKSTRHNLTGKDHVIL